MSNVPAKETVYIDVEDDVTSIIDKVTSSKADIVAVVMPKRSGSLQSVTNMRLLKKSSEQANKKMVLVTKDQAIMPLAGLAEVYVAESLTSKPYVPTSPEASLTHENPQELDSDLNEIDPTKPIGELDDGSKMVDLDDGDIRDLDAPVELSPPSKPKSKKGTKVPNFNSFRKKLFIGLGALVAVILLWYWAFVIIPKANIIVSTDTSSSELQLAFVADANVEQADEETLLARANVGEFTQSNSRTVEATGEENRGERATGTMTLTNCINDGLEKTVPAGTSFSTGNLNFVTTRSVVLAEALFSGRTCRSGDQGYSQEVPVRAENPGTEYNLGSRDYQSSISGILASGSDMAGGTDRKVSIVSRSDIDSARNGLIEDVSDNDIRQNITQELEQAGYLPIIGTYTRGEVEIEQTAEVGDEADEVTVSANANHTMLGVNKSDLEKFIASESTEQLDSADQVLVDSGLDQARFRLVDRQSNDRAQIEVTTIIVVGPDLDIEQIKADLAKMRRGEAIRDLEGRTGVREAEIAFSPFWVSKIPNRANRVNIEIVNVNDVPDVEPDEDTEE
jgi:hypothetical protein